MQPLLINVNQVHSKNFMCLIALILMTIPQGGNYYHNHFMNEQSEAPRGRATYTVSPI